MFDRFQRLAHRVLRMSPTEYGLDARQGRGQTHAQARGQGDPDAHEGARAADDGGAMSLKWRLLAAQESARPGFMTLRAVREGGQVVDFVWDFVSAAAARMLHDDCAHLEGRRLRNAFAGRGEAFTLFEQYRRVVDLGTAEASQQLHLVEGRQDSFRHGVVRLGDGVAVTLINLSAAARAKALAQQLAEQQRSRASAPHRSLAGNGP